MAGSRIYLLYSCLVLQINKSMYIYYVFRGLALNLMNKLHSKQNHLKLFSHPCLTPNCSGFDHLKSRIIQMLRHLHVNFYFVQLRGFQILLCIRIAMQINDPLLNGIFKDGSRIGLTIMYSTYIFCKMWKYCISFMDIGIVWLHSDLFVLWKLSRTNQSSGKKTEWSQFVHKAPTDNKK